MNLLQQFLDFLKNQKNKPSFATVKNYKADIGQFINWLEKEFKLVFDPSRITPQILEQYRKSRMLSSASIQRHISSLRKFSSFLKLKGLIDFDLFAIQAPSEKILADPWMIRNFKSHLYEYKKSNLTIKNYINDIKNFFEWLSEVSLTKHEWNVTEKNLLKKINFGVVDEYKQRLIAIKFSPRTINRKLSSLRNYISWTQKQGLIPSGHPEYIKNEILLRQPAAQNDNKIAYSSFPPIRLAQKSLKLFDLIFDNLFIEPLAEIIQNTQYLFWKISGKKIFKKAVILNRQLAQNNKVLNIQKEFYAPLNVSLQYLPAHKKIWHHIRYSRPKWYKTYHSYSFTHYFHFAILIILSCAIGFGAYNELFPNVKKDNGVLGTFTNTPPRILSFQGKLTDSLNNPIVKTTNILFSIYNYEKALETASLWHEENMVKPDSDGAFSTLIGKNIPIQNTLFNENPKLYLGIKVGNSPELTPRQQLATVAFASNAETLQGLEPITNSTKVSNVVLALDSSGNLSIAGEKTHTFQTIGGQFVLSGKILSLNTIPGSNSNVEINPDGLGKIDFSKPIQNSSNNNNMASAVGAVEIDDMLAILATTSGQSAFYINQDSTGPLISASTSGIAKFTVDSDGTGTFAGSIGVNGSSLTSTATTFNLLDSNVATLNFASTAATLNMGAVTGTITIRNALTNIQGNVNLGDANTDILTFNGRVAQDSDLIPITTSGTNDLGYSSLPWDNAYINSIYTAKLDVQDSQSATAAAQIFNTNSGSDADGLIIKLGNTSTTAVNANNHFISFETAGIGIVGSIQGNGGKGITYATSGIADFAEYLKKDKDQIIEYGSVICLSGNGLAVKCDNDHNKIAGVASERPAFLGGENLGAGSVAVGLVGQVETFVSTLNGEIKAGDMLTASDIPGVSVKATNAGQVIGKALENLDTIDEAKIVGYYNPDSREYRSKDNLPNIPKKPNIIPILKIHALVNASWYDPGTHLAQNGDLIINKTKSNEYSIANSNNETLTNIAGFLSVIAANIKTGLLNASEVVTNSLIVTSDNIIVNGKNLKDYIADAVNELGIKNNELGVISPISRVDKLSANIISPLGESLIVRLATPSAEIRDSSFIIQNSSGSAIATINSDGDASFSGTLSSHQLEVSSDASISGILRARSIIADSISGFIDIASFSAQLAYVPNLQAEQGLFNQGLMVFGSTSLADLSVAGNLSIGTTMFLTQNSIETLGADLSLQSLRQGKLSIMGGLVFIDTEGNITTQGNLSIKGTLAVSGNIIASGSATLSKLNFNFVSPVLALSPTEVIASSSAGIANISPYYAELTIKNALVTSESVIYITPVGTPSAQTPFLMRQVPDEPASPQGGSFTVGVESPNKNPIPFNWLIVN